MVFVPGSQTHQRSFQSKPSLLMFTVRFGIQLSSWHETRETLRVCANLEALFCFVSEILGQVLMIASDSSCQGEFSAARGTAADKPGNGTTLNVRRRVISSRRARRIGVADAWNIQMPNHATDYQCSRKCAL